MPPYPRQKEQIMSRYLWAGFVALLLLIVALGVYTTREPTRLDEAQAALRVASVGSAAAIYVENCAVCHGANGEGIGTLPPLDSEALRAADYDDLFKVIARGRYGTAMTGWHQDEGGMLTTYQVDQLVALIRYAAWGEVRELAAQHGMLPAVLAVPEVSNEQMAQVAELGPEGQLWAEGFQLYATRCTACHGANGEGSSLGVALNTPEVRAQDAETLQRTITMGVAGTLMSPWEQVLEQEEIAALVAFLQHWDALAAEGVELTMPTPVPLDLSDPQAILALGEQLFVTTCTSCHGIDGTGGIGPAINSQQFLSRKDDAALTEAITMGGHRPNSVMPAFGERFTSVEIGAIVDYIRSLEATAPSIADPRGTQQGGGGPPWLRATPDADNPISPGGGQGWGRGQGQGQGQGQGNQQTPSTPAAETLSYRGTVISVNSNALTFRDSATGASVEAMLGPPWWWGDGQILLRPGDSIALEGFIGEGHMELNWIENVTTGERIDLRRADGTPVWQQ
ncbi:MAG: c-type cytochrome [Candidatus Viridilinea halotolerans]|uniref:C-type cytochrome n=1 Tax=Candidatus Viridilinea halotolerans TaxID=2491704 RepID=A0A426U856_9CHLR|nr:MAG: c-type cytochrome [Candidatus Viridilinea halotolerans]